MTDYIRKAVELADGWEWTPEWHPESDDLIHCPWPLPEWHPDDLTDLDKTIFLDALAAQLVRQVDALPYIRVQSQKECVTIRDSSPGMGMPELAGSIGPDRTMNTIKAIVDSGVLG